MFDCLFKSRVQFRFLRVRRLFNHEYFSRELRMVNNQPLLVRISSKNKLSLQWRPNNQLVFNKIRFDR